MREEVNHDDLNEKHRCEEGNSRHRLLILILDVSRVAKGAKDEEGSQAEYDNMDRKHNDVQPHYPLISL